MNVKIIQSPKLPDDIAPKKVAAYCRVRTTQEIQTHSLKVQRAYFEKR